MGERSPLRHYPGRGSDPSSAGDDLSEHDGFLPSNPDGLGSVGYEAGQHSRGGSTSFQPNNGEGIGSLVRLVEALEMYDHGVMESYMSEDSLESQALKGSYHKGGYHKRKQSEDLQSLSNYSEMPYPTPIRKGPVTNKMLEKFCAADMDDEYCALPFNHDSEYADAQDLTNEYMQKQARLNASREETPETEAEAEGDPVKKGYFKRIAGAFGTPFTSVKKIKNINLNKPINSPSDFNLKVPDWNKVVPKLPRMKLNLNRKGGGMPKSNEPDDPRPDLSDPTPMANWPLRPYQRKVKFNLLGLLFVTMNVIALGFYLWVRITKTLGLGSYVWYGWLVLIIEILGATTTILYGVNILFDPVHEDLPMDPDNPGLTMVQMPYHVRVLIPCYKESVSIVSKTCKAAYDALLPAGCTRTIYLCDDGKDPQKCKLLEYLGKDFVYVSGRKRAVGEMNGKSSNLNNCLAQIYPPGIPIPPNELVCIFDADQVAHTDFYIRTLPLFDAGDDVGMVLSPQYFHNVDFDADIFNHSNVQFWEYAQHGYDAIGFNSCTGTNFLVRASAFEEVGWSPTYTLTEDYALGMELTMRHWKCRYVERYLATGEAPEQLRNCFQQRSRWCKGHFQIVLSNDHCPLFQSRLSLFQRIMYCSGVWSYIVGAIATPFFIAVPLVTIWGGIFPIVVSQWAAIGLTAYFVTQFLVLNYVRKFSHMRPLWFANVANNILWFTFVKGCWRAAGAACGKSLTFKTTIKGANALMNSAIGDLWMPSLVLVTCLASFGFGMNKVISEGSIITTLSISLVWIFYALIPPYLLIHYHMIGRGQTLRYASKIAYFLSFFCAIAAIILIWLVYPRAYDYEEVLEKVFQFYDSQRLGELPSNFRIPWRSSALTYEIGPQGLDWGNVTGGWMAGGVGGTVKHTIPIATSTAMLAWSYLSFTEGYTKANQTQYLEETLRVGADYLMKMFEPIPTTNASAPVYAMIYQVGNVTADSAVWTRPEEITMARPTYYISTANGTSDLGGQVVAALVSTALVFQERDPDYYATLMSEATGLYGAITRTDEMGMYSAYFIYECAPTSPTATTITVNTATCEAPDKVFNGSLVYWYNSTSYLDDLAWAAAWLYQATGDSSYETDAYNFFQEHVDSTEGEWDEYYLVNWDNLIYPVSILMQSLSPATLFESKAQALLQKWICSSSAKIAYTDHGRAYNFYDLSNAQTMNAAMMALIYAQIITPPTVTDVEAVTPYSDPYLAKKYTCFAMGQSRYMLGDHSQSFVVGFGKNNPTQAHDRGASCPASPTNCTDVNGLYNPDPNPHVINGALVYNPLETDDFKDDRTNNDTYVSIEWNWGIAGVAAGLAQTTSTYEQCLQGYGIYSSEGEICNDNS